jgi:outer membrane lipoprotein carrier protein
MRKIFATLIVFVLFGSLANAQQPLSQPDIKSLLERIREKRVAAPQMQADFQEEKIIHLMNKPIVSTGKVWFQPPNKFRRDVKGNSPSITVSDGQQLWIYYPNFKSAEHYSLGKRSPVDSAIAAINTALNLENVENTFQISGEKLGDASTLHLLPQSSSMKRIFQKLDLRISSDLFVERTEMLQPNGDRLVTTYSNHSRVPIPESTFEFKPPAGVEITTPLGK